MSEIRHIKCIKSIVYIIFDSLKYEKILKKGVIYERRHARNAKTSSENAG